MKWNEEISHLKLGKGVEQTFLQRRQSKGSRCVHVLNEKHKSKLQWEATSHLLGWLLFFVRTANVGKNGILDSLCTVGGSTQWGGRHCGNRNTVWVDFTHTHICLEGQQGRNWYGEKEEWKWCEKSACGVCLCACVCDIIQIPLLSIVSPNFKSSSQEDVCTPICIVAPFTILSKFYRFSECLHLTKQSLLVRIWKPGHIWKHAEAFLVNASRTQTYFHKMFSLSLLLFGKCCWNRDVH